MSGAGDLWVFAGVMVLGQFSPGPDMLLLTRTALKEGAGAGVRMALGVACGLCLHTALAVGGMAVAFQSFPVLRLLLQWAAAIYLLYLAWCIARERFVEWYSGAMRENEAAESRHTPFMRGLMCNLLNPKAALFLAAVCAPFLTGDRPAWFPWAMWGIVVGLGVVLWSAWVVLLQWPRLRNRYERSARWIDGVFALVLAALAVKLMLGA